LQFTYTPFHTGNMSFQNVVENSTTTNLNGTTNGTTNGHTAAHKYDPNFTDSLINAMGPKTPDRARFVLGKLIRHLHDFVRETELTPEEWMRGVQFINAIGQISDSKRNEGQRICDVLGIESYVEASLTVQIL
jgi:hypothetical protein